MALAIAPRSRERSGPPRRRLLCPQSETEQCWDVVPASCGHRLTGDMPTVERQAGVKVQFHLSDSARGAPDRESGFGSGVNHTLA